MADSRRRLEALFDGEFRNKCLRLARRMLRGDECSCGMYSAADVVHDTVENLCRRPGNLWSSRDPHAFVFKAVKHCALDHFKTHKPSNFFVSLGLVECFWPADGLPNPEERLIKIEHEQDVSQWLRELSAEDRLIVHLKYGDALTNNAIAKVLGRDENYVKNGLRRILKSWWRKFVRSGRSRE